MCVFSAKAIPAAFPDFLAHACLYTFFPHVYSDHVRSGVLLVLPNVDG